MLLAVKNNVKSHKRILIILAVLFFIIYSFLIFGNDLQRFTWPDETANYFFIANYIANGNFSVAEPLNDIADNLIKPRSFNIYQNNLVPGSFLGMLLIYGLAGKIVGPNLILFLTPLLAAIAGLYFYKLMLKIFQPNIAFFSALLFFLNPAWWYYANFSMLPNIPFISFLIIGFYYLANIDRDAKQNNWLYVSLAGFFIGMSLIIRTNEFVWILGLLFFLAAIYYKKIKWQYVVLFLFVMSFVFIPIFYYNQLTYGNALSFGYLKLEQDNSGLASQLPPEFKTSEQGSVLDIFKFMVLPFGFSPGSFSSNFYSYFINLFWWIFIPAAIGVFILLKNFHKKAKAAYFIIFFCLGIYLVVYYGSWVFADTFTLQLNKIGLSYVRYWLPIYILSLPLVAVFFLYFVDIFRSNKFKLFLSFLLVLIFLFFNLNVLYVSGNDNLTKIKGNIKDYNQINRQITELTEANAIIISERSDKIFFPQRKVISKWEYDEIESWLYLLQSGYPLYYYAFEGPDYIDEFSYYLAVDFDLMLDDEFIVNEKESLYKIKMIEYDYEYIEE